ncbi:hypothetical protein M9H77_23766 [Catharanthus roseus]|uniref:Uncharacterized protein n=1 Tax=Catharanthus roseus TaxID=4058 RepID=A0ACC0AX13_CATRO|nr:hypothetical protein M9H77_23766 [Catharanthus roseus]
MELSSTCESSNLDVMTCSLVATSSSYLFTSERDSKYAFLVISQVADLDAPKLRALSNKVISNFSKGAVASTFTFFISSKIISYSTSMEDIDSIEVCERLVSVPMMISMRISVARLGASGHHSWIGCFGQRISLRNCQSQKALKHLAIFFSMKPCHPSS